MGVFDQGKLQAVVVYHNYDPEAETIEMSSASINPNWLSRDVLAAMYSYPFDELKCQAVFKRTQTANVRLQRQFKALGLELYTIPRMNGRNKDLALWVLTDDAWRINKFNKKRTTNNG